MPNYLRDKFAEVHKQNYMRENVDTSCSEELQNSVILEASMKTDKLGNSENPSTVDCSMPFEKAKIIENFRNDGPFEFEEDDSRPNSSRILSTSRASEGYYSGRASHEIREI